MKHKIIVEYLLIEPGSTHKGTCLGMEFEVTEDVYETLKLRDPHNLNYVMAMDALQREIDDWNTFAHSSRVLRVNFLENNPANS